MNQTFVTPLNELLILKTHSPGGYHIDLFLPVLEFGKRSCCQICNSEHNEHNLLVHPLVSPFLLVVSMSSTHHNTL